MVVDITQYIDHTVLKPTTTANDIDKLCEEAMQHSFFAVCVPPYYVQQAKDILKDTAIKVSTVIGFPLGYSTNKEQEILQAIENGADEVDMVHNIAAIKSSDYMYAEWEVKNCIATAHKHEVKIKIILETGLLSGEEIANCCQLYTKYNPDFIKTSTGFSETGATVEVIQQLKSLIPAHIGIKASGGIRNFAFAAELIAAGATRIGCSASVQILEQSKLS